MSKPSASASRVYVVTAWNERTNNDTVLVFADKNRAEQAWARLSGEDPEHVYGGVVRRTIQQFPLRVRRTS